MIEEPTSQVMDEQEKVQLFVPLDIEDSLRKSDDVNDTRSWYTRGFASTPSLDNQNDIVRPEGIDISHFIQHGHINYEHNKGTPFEIGKPTENCYVDMEKGLFVEAKLDKGNPYAKVMFNLAESIAKSGSNQKLGYSIEGDTVKRNIVDPRKVESVRITNVALTTNPANTEATWESLMKSMAKALTTGHEINPEEMTGAAAFRAETLGRELHHFTYRLKEIEQTGYADVIWKQVGGYLDATKKTDKETMTIFLQLAKGLSKSDAEKEIYKLFKV